MVHLPEPPGAVPAGNHRAAARWPHDQGPAAHLALHPQRQSRQQRDPGLRLRLLQLQVLEVRLLTRRRAWVFLTLVAVTAFALLSVQAGAERKQIGNLIVSLDGGISPKA